MVMATDASPTKRRKALWRQLAYAARYGKQPLSDLMALSMRDLGEFGDALSSIVEDEQKPRPG